MYPDAANGYSAGKLAANCGMAGGDSAAATTPTAASSYGADYGRMLVESGAAAAAAATNGASAAAGQVDYTKLLGPASSYHQFMQVNGYAAAAVAAAHLTAGIVPTSY